MKGETTRRREREQQRKSRLLSLLLIVGILGLGAYLFLFSDNFSSNTIISQPPELPEIIIADNESIRTDTSNVDTADNISLVDGKIFFDLSSEGVLEVTMDEVKQYQLRTNSTRIVVTIPQSESGTFLLFNAHDDSDFIATLSLDQNNRTGRFDNLTSAKNYYITAEGLGDTVVFAISD